MRPAALVIVVAGIVFAIGVALAGDFDMAGAVILGLIAAVGLLAAAVVRRSAGGAAPAQCGSCGGLISPHAPYCKHCGASVSGSPGF